ncbi:MAG: restriction endonuclease subunit S [Armatimonadetes bacterium]|nr:restriction endonuclease subunit S [Armatimonadota bacterium]
MKWETVKLGEVIVPAKLRRAGNGDFPILSMTMHNGLVDQGDKFKKRIASADISPYKVVERNQLVVGFPIDEGVLAFQNLYPEAIVSPAYDIWELRNPEGVDPNYLQKLLRSPRSLAYYTANLRSTTARRRTIPKEAFLDMPIPLPPLSEQERIASLLDAADRLRAQRRDALRRLDALTHSLFLDAFGDPAHNPKNWPVVKLTEISRPKQWPTIAANQLSGSGHPVFGANGLIGYHDIYNHAEPTVLITCRGATCGTINVCPPKTYVTGNAMALDNLAEDKIHRTFLEWFLKGKGLRNVISGTAQPQITREGLTNYTVALPPLSLQLEFASRLEQIEGLRSRMERQGLELDGLFASLQSAAFAGP